MNRIILSAIAIFFLNAAIAQVAINTDGSPVTDPEAMLEIKKIDLAKVRIRSTSFADTSQLEFSNRNSINQGTDFLFSLNREQGLLISSRSDISSRVQDSIMAFRFFSGRTYFGMNVKNPISTLHVHDPISASTNFRMTNNVTGAIGPSGLLLNINGNTASIVNAESGSLNFGTNNQSWGGFTSTGNFGIGNFSPSEKLVVGGNLILSGSNKGVILDGQDRPLITRGFDLFTSGNYNGLGRWGMFMEPSTLTFGIPDLAGKSFAFSKYSANSVPEKVLTITNTGEVNKPSTGATNLLPLAYGNVAANGNILNGTGNFTVAVVATRIYDITVTGETLNDNNTTAMITVTTDGQGALGHWVWYLNGKMRVYISTTTDIYPRNFSFILYKP